LGKFGQNIFRTPKTLLAPTPMNLLHFRSLETLLFIPFFHRATKFTIVLREKDKSAWLPVMNAGTFKIMFLSIE